MGRFVSFALTLGVSLAKNIDDGYIPAPNVGANVGDPAMMQGYLLKDAAITDNAVCLDGSPGLYYHRKGTGTGENKWYIHQEGGGWCSSLPACLTRSQMNLGSSKKIHANRILERGVLLAGSADQPTDA